MILTNIFVNITISIIYVVPAAVPGKKRPETMKKAIFEIHVNDRFLIVDTFDNTIAASAPGGVFPTIKIGRNESHALKFNKSSISTCNIEFLLYMLKNCDGTFMNVYGYIKNRAMFAGDIAQALQDYNVTRAAFYAAFNDDLDAFTEFFTSCSAETRQQIIFDHCCSDHDGKMDGVISCSTYVGANKYCAARCKNCDNAICKYCFAASLTAQRAGLKNKLRRIHAVLTAVELSAADIPELIPYVWPFFRFEAFGDLNNVIQFNNYNLFAAVNPDVNFTLWTKNPGIIQAAINDGLNLANNLVIGLSSLYLNKPELDKAKKYPFIRFLFTVYDDAYIQAHDIQINCGAKHCITCGICYKYLHEYKGGLYIINERKK